MRYTIFAIFLLIGSFVFSQEKQAEAPRLLVGIKIDGLQAERVSLLQKSFTSGGFRKIISEGKAVERMSYDILSAGNASDAATCVTGAYPFYHGISGDKYFNTKESKAVSVLSDERQTGIGTRDKFSAHNLLSSTFTDELMLASPLSKVHSIAPDAENAIMMGGHTATSVTWIDDKTNRWVTTGYYNKGLSPWADAMNVSGDFGKQGKLTTSQTNKLITKLARAMLDKELLGMDKYTDALMLQYSVKPPNATATSAEKDALYMDLDMELQSLIFAVTSKIGADKTLIFIVGDASDVHTPLELGNNKIPSGYFNADRALALINSYLMAIYGQEKWINGYFGKNIFLNKKKIEDKKLNVSEFVRRICDFLVEFEGIQAAYPVADIINFSGNRVDMRSKYRNSYHKNTSGDIVITLLPGWVEVDDDGKAVGEANSPNCYVPFYLFGDKIKSRKLNQNASVVDIAPTISEILGLPLPNACVGKSVLE